MGDGILGVCEMVYWEMGDGILGDGGWYTGGGEMVYWGMEDDILELVIRGWEMVYWGDRRWYIRAGY